MKLACFDPDSLFSAWSLGQGMTETLTRMGHEVTVCKLPATRELPKDDFAALKAKLPTLEQLGAQDGIILSGPEHIKGWLAAVYGQEAWGKLKVPKAGWYHESFERDDYRLDFEKMQPWSTEHFFPARQDAEKYKGTWLPFGADTEIFRPCPLYGTTDYCTCEPEETTGICGTLGPPQKKYDAAFIGLVYEKRQKFLAELAPHLKGIDFRLGNVQVVDLGGLNHRKTAELYAENIRQIRVFVNLPSLSRLLVTKVFEVMACGTFLLTPNMHEAARLNADDLRGRCVFYDSASSAGCADSIADFLKDASGRDELARQGCEEVHANHRLDQRLEAMLTKMGLAVAA